MTIIAETSAPVRGPGRGHASAVPSGHTSTGILHMQPSRPVECDSNPLDVQFALRMTAIFAPIRTIEDRLAALSARNGILAGDPRAHRSCRQRREGTRCRRSCRGRRRSEPVTAQDVGEQVTRNDSLGHRSGAAVGPPGRCGHGRHGTDVGYHLHHVARQPLEDEAERDTGPRRPPYPSIPTARNRAKHRRSGIQGTGAGAASFEYDAVKANEAADFWQVSVKYRWQSPRKAPPMPRLRAELPDVHRSAASIAFA